MGFPSQAGQFGIITQATAGAYTNPGAASPNNGVFLRYRGGGLGTNRELLTPDPEIGGNRDIPNAFMGPISNSGEIQFYARMEGLATLFYAAFGSKSSTTAGTGPTLVGTHTITPNDAANPPYLSIEENIGGSLETFNYFDAVVNSIGLECDPDGYLMGTAGIIARRQSAGNTKTATPADIDTTPLMVGTSMIITIGGVSTYVTRSWSLDFTNNYEDDTFTHGSVYLADLTPKRRELTMKTTIRPTNITLWREAVFGSAAATVAQSGAAATKAVSAVITTYSNIGTSTTPFTFQIDIPFCTIKPFNIEPNGDDVIEYDVEFQAVRPTNTALATVTIKNGLAAVL